MEQTFISYKYKEGERDREEGRKGGDPCVRARKKLIIIVRLQQFANKFNINNIMW